MTPPASPDDAVGGVGRAVLWLPGLAVAVGAAVATAHTATARLAGRAARYAWSVVVLAAGLSGLAQAAYLAGGPAVEVSPVLRFGVGAWPALAAAVVAHLLYLLTTAPATTHATVQPAAVQSGPVQAAQGDPFTRPTVQGDSTTPPVGAAEQPDPRPASAVETAGPDGTPSRAERPSAPSPARDRAAARPRGTPSATGRGPRSPPSKPSPRCPAAPPLPRSKTSATSLSRCT